MVVTDPYDSSTGLKLPTLTANVVTVSHDHPQHNNAKAVGGSPKVFNWPGEYETMGVHFKSIHSFHNAKDDKEQNENSVFTININGFRVCHLGDQGTKLTPEQLEQVGEVDILFVPVGGKDTVDAKKAKEIVEQIEPRIVIPMAYNTDGSKMGFDPVDPFLSAMGNANAERLPVFTCKKSELPEDTTKLVVLEQIQ